MRSTIVKVSSTAAAAAAVAAGMSGMLGGVAQAGGSQAVDGDGPGLPTNMSRMVGGNSGAICAGGGGDAQGGLGLNLISGLGVLSDRALKRDVTAVDWSDLA